MLKRLVKILRIPVGVLFGVAGIALLIPPVLAIPRFSQFTAYQFGGLSGSILMALLAFALARQRLKKRT